jgi:hypothetical protein
MLLSACLNTASKMRQTLIIITLLILGCSTTQEQTVNNISADRLKVVNEKKPEFILTETNNCEQTKLSNQFDIVIDFKRYVDTIEIDQICFLQVVIKDKSSKTIIDSFSIQSSFLYSFMFLSCDSMTSYTTKFKVDREIVDNFYGDIVVADFNFDGYDDIAVVNDGGGNGGPLYSFYLQNNDRKFIKDNFLTDSVSFFPSKFNSKEKTLTTYVHAGVCDLGEHIYKLDKAKNNWTEKSHRLINICE